MFDENFTPRGTADLTRYSKTHGQAMQTILSLPPQVQEQVWAIVGSWKKAIGMPVPPAVEEILSKWGIGGPTKTRGQAAERPEPHLPHCGSPEMGRAE